MVYLPSPTQLFPWLKYATIDNEFQFYFLPPNFSRRLIFLRVPSAPSFRPDRIVRLCRIPGNCGSRWRWRHGQRRRRRSTWNLPLGGHSLLCFPRYCQNLCLAPITERNRVGLVCIVGCASLFPRINLGTCRYRAKNTKQQKHSHLFLQWWRYKSEISQNGDLCNRSHRLKHVSTPFPTATRPDIGLYCYRCRWKKANLQSTVEL